MSEQVKIKVAYDPRATALRRDAAPAAKWDPSTKTWTMSGADAIRWADAIRADCSRVLEYIEDKRSWSCTDRKRKADAKASLAIADQIAAAAS